MIVGMNCVLSLKLTDEACAAPTTKVNPERNRPEHSGQFVVSFAVRVTSVVRVTFVIRV